MTWQIVMILQIILSAILAIITRKVSKASSKAFMSIGLLVYGVLAVVGVIISTIATKGIPELPPQHVWLFIALEGIAMPTAWMLSYAIIKHTGASSMAIVKIFSTLVVAASGIVLLHEPIHAHFILGATLIIASTVLSLYIKPGKNEKRNISLYVAILLMIGFSIATTVGIFFEKSAISVIGAWDYAFYGWIAQFLGMVILMTLFGRKEIKHIDRKTVQNGIILGITTSTVGALLIYALQLGTLSATILATSGKAALTMILAAIFLNERNQPFKRVLAFLLAMVGLWLLMK